MWDLHQNTGAVAKARICAGGAAVFEVAEDADRVRHDLMRLSALDVGDKADAAGVLFLRRVIEAQRRRTVGMEFRFDGGIFHVSRFDSRGRRMRAGFDQLALVL